MIGEEEGYGAGVPPAQWSAVTPPVFFFKNIFYEIFTSKGSSSSSLSGSTLRISKSNSNRPRFTLFKINTNLNQINQNRYLKYLLWIRSVLLDVEVEDQFAYGELAGSVQRVCRFVLICFFVLRTSQIRCCCWELRRSIVVVAWDLAEFGLEVMWLRIIVRFRWDCCDFG